MLINESKRITDLNDGQRPHYGFLCFIVHTSDCESKLKLIKKVVLAISRADPENWPGDEEWNSILPNWFLTKIKSHNLEEIETNNQLLWDYGSWLDAMRYRGWEWYSSKIEANKIIIHLIPMSFPYSVNPLEYVIYETGVLLNDILFYESN